jgi:hypothetical protein
MTVKSLHIQSKHSAFSVAFSLFQHVRLMFTKTCFHYHFVLYTMSYQLLNLCCRAPRVRHL